MILSKLINIQAIKSSKTPIIDKNILQIQLVIFNKNMISYDVIISQQQQMQVENEGNKQRKIGYYLLGKTIGEGTFGKVKLATHTLTGQKVAIKILVKEKIVDVADVERVSRQIHILKLIRHPSIIQLYEIIETCRHLFLIMQYVENGQLFDQIVKKGKIDEVQACKYFKQIISGVSYLHRLNIVHRDLKPQNLLIDWKKTLKIVDFGLSNTYKNDEQLKTACGSPCYAAPEMIANKKYRGLQVDIWSCGVILFAMVCGYLPFEDSNTSQLYKKILSGQYVLPNFVSESFKDLLQKILHVEPSKRFKLQQIYEHQWCQLANDIPLNNGIIIGFHRMPVDQDILQKLTQFQFDLDYSLRCIEANKHNHITTTYYLLLKKHLKAGNKSIADLGALDFDYTSIQPFKRVDFQNKHSFFGNHQQGPIINLDSNDIQLKNNKKNIFTIEPKSSKTHQRRESANENRRSNNFFNKDKRIEAPKIQFRKQQLGVGTRKFQDLKMYLKVPKKKEYHSQVKKTKEEKRRVLSVYQEQRNETIRDTDYPLVIRLPTDQSEQKPIRNSLKSRAYKSKFPQTKFSRFQKTSFKLE